MEVSCTGTALTILGRHLLGIAQHCPDINYSKGIDVAYVLNHSTKVGALLSGTLHNVNSRTYLIGLNLNIRNLWTAARN